MQSHQDIPKIRVKFMARPEARIWRRQLPDIAPIWGQCEFIFDPEERNYDWLVVYDDLPPQNSERRSMRSENLACPATNTILVTSEPSSIKSYFSDFTDQFGYILTSQPSWALPHRNRIFQQPALQWFYGIGSKNEISFDNLLSSVYPEKSKLVSTVGSSKKETHTLHSARYEFLSEVKRQIEGIDVFGRTDIAMDDKAEAVAPYRFHLAVENHISTHHWTEKLADPFLGEAVPLYVGCPNAADYFPEESFIELNINNVDSAVNIIRNLTTDDYLRRLPHVLEAKRRVMHEYNLFAVISNQIQSAPKTQSSNASVVIMSRRRKIKQNPFSSLKHLYQKSRLRWLHKFGKN